MPDLNTAADSSNYIHLTTTIVAAYVRGNSLSAGDVPALLNAIHGTLKGLSDDSGNSSGGRDPAVSVKKSITDDYLVCLEDGKKLKMLKRYLRSRYKLTPDQYRTKWNLPHDYPMVAANYSKRRSDLAKKIGLGHVHDATGKRKARK